MRYTAGSAPDSSFLPPFDIQAVEPEGGKDTWSLKLFLPAYDLFWLLGIHFLFLRSYATKLSALKAPGR